MAYVSCRTCKHSYVFDGVNGSIHYICNMIYGINCIDREYYYYEPKYKIEIPKEFISKEEMKI